MKPDWLEEHTTDFERAELEKHEAEMKKKHEAEYIHCNDKTGEDK
jgi:hypothetical protein